MLRARLPALYWQFIQPWRTAAREPGSMAGAAAGRIGAAATAPPACAALAAAAAGGAHQLAAIRHFSGASNSSASSSSAQTAPTTSSSTTSAEEPPLLARASAAFNTLTGYDAVEGLKREVADADTHLRSQRVRLSAARAAYEAALAEQRGLSREMGVLLQRKSSWGPDDVARFTEVYAREHATEGAVADAKAGYEAAGAAVESAQEELMVRIRERYTQEQLYSDKIRRAATWWTWGLMGLQAASFVTVYAFMEPRRRALLASSVGDLLEAQGRELRGQIEGLRGEVAALSLGAGSSSKGSRSSRDSGSTGGVVDATSPDAAVVADGTAAEKQQAHSTAEEQKQQPHGAAPAAGEAAAAETKQRPQSAPERWARGAASAVARGWCRAANAALKRCPQEVTLSREQAAGLAVASAAAGGAIALLVMAALSLAAGGRGGGGGSGGGAASSGGSMNWGTGA